MTIFLPAQSLKRLSAMVMRCKRLDIHFVFCPQSRLKQRLIVTTYNQQITEISQIAYVPRLVYNYSQKFLFVLEFYLVFGHTLSCSKQRIGVAFRDKENRSITNMWCFSEAFSIIDY